MVRSQPSMERASACAGYAMKCYILLAGALAHDRHRHCLSSRTLHNTNWYHRAGQCSEVGCVAVLSFPDHSFAPVALLACQPGGKPSTV